MKFAEKPGYCFATRVDIAQKDQSDEAQSIVHSLGCVSSTRYLVTASNQDHIVLHKSERILVNIMT